MLKPDLSDYAITLQKYGPNTWTWRAWHIHKTSVYDPLRPKRLDPFTAREQAEADALQAIQHHAESETINGNDLRDRVEARGRG